MNAPNLAIDTDADKPPQLLSLWHGLILADGGDIRLARVTVSGIKTATAKHFNLTEKVLISQWRIREVARPRQISMWLSKKLTKLSLPHIGRLHGGRDHTTVLAAVRRIDALRIENAEVYEATESLLAQLRNMEFETA